MLSHQPQNGLLVLPNLRLLNSTITHMPTVHCLFSILAYTKNKQDLSNHHSNPQFVIPSMK